MNSNPWFLLSNRTKTIVAALGILILATSCSIEKRHYRNGFYLNWDRASDHLNSETIADESEQSSSDVFKTNALPETEIIPETAAPVEQIEISSTHVDVISKSDCVSDKGDSLEKADRKIPEVERTAKLNLDEDDDIKLGLLSLATALVGFLLITFLFDLLPVVVPTIIAVAGLLGAAFFLVLSIRWHLKRNKKRKAAGEKAEVGRRLLHAVLVAATILIAFFALVVAVFNTDW